MNKHNIDPGNAKINFAPLEKRLENFIASRQATIGIALIYEGSDILTINNDSEYPLMSVFKLHQAIAILKKLEQSRTRLSDKIFIKQGDLLPDTYSPLRDSYPRGNIQLSIMELLSYSLQLSDNNACDILFDRIIDPAGTDQIIRAFGIESFRISQNEADMHRDLANCYRNWSTPLAVAELIEKTLTGKILSSEYMETLKKLLTECKTGTDRIPKYLPAEGIVLGHKTGTGDKNSKQEIIGLNDAGFVFLPDGKRYVLAVMIKNSQLSYTETSEIIAKISEMAFDYLESMGTAASHE